LYIQLDRICMGAYWDRLWALVNTVMNNKIQQE
jgi:hypothetical protein